MAEDRLEPIQPGLTQSPNSTDDEWPLERIRAEGTVYDDETKTTDSGITTRAYIVCDGPRSACENDQPLRVPYQHAALEVTQDGQSALFDLGANELYWAAEFHAGWVFVMDDPRDDAWGGNVLEYRYRVLRADGAEVDLQLVTDVAPAVPGPDLFVVDYGEDANHDGFEDVYLVDLRAGTLRPLDVPRPGGIGSLPARHWGPNVDEFLWFADRNCTVQWATEDGAFVKDAARPGGSGPDCAAGWDPPTYIHSDMFPDGWLQPGRLALLERNDHRLFVHVSLDYGETWQRIRVSDEAAVPDVLRQLG
jgi:hypothetical protein